MTLIRKITNQILQRSRFPILFLCYLRFREIRQRSDLALLLQKVHLCNSKHVFFLYKIHRLLIVHIYYCNYCRSKIDCTIFYCPQLTSENVVSSYIERIKEIQPILNCIVQDCFEEALKDARKCDELLKSQDALFVEYLEKEKPLFGVPFTTKVTPYS